MMRDNHKLAIVFDFGRVLVDWDPHFLYRKLFPDDESIERFLAETHFYEWVLEQDAGRPFAETIAEMCTLYPQYCDMIRAYDLRYEEALGGPIWATVDIVRSLKKAGYPLYGLTNWPHEKFYLVRPKYKFFDLFDDIVVSGEVKLIKPDPRIFTLLLERMGRRAAECLFIDDSPKNIAVAEDLGFKTIHYHSPDQLCDELGKYLGQEALACDLAAR